jgi:hypothetical protein
VAQDASEGVQESGAGTREHLEFMPLELIQGPNAKLNRRQATFCSPICVIITIIMLLYQKQMIN